MEDMLALVNLARAENHEGAMKKWLKLLNSTPFGIKPTEAKSLPSGSSRRRQN
jgi:hypothetical protein